MPWCVGQNEPVEQHVVNGRRRVGHCEVVAPMGRFPVGVRTNYLRFADGQCCEESMWRRTSLSLVLPVALSVLPTPGCWRVSRCVYMSIHRPAKTRSTHNLEGDHNDQDGFHTLADFVCKIFDV